MKLEKLLYIWIVNNLADKDSYTVNSYTLFAGLYESNKKLKRIQHVRSFLSENKTSHKERVLLESFHKINDIERNKRPKSYKRVGHQCPNRTLSSTTKKAE